MIAIVLAAGKGSRLGAYSRDTPKGLVPVAGKGFLVRQLETLESAGITDVTIVTGHGREQIEALGRPTRHNDRFASTNMVASLMCAADLLGSGEDVLVAYADIVYEPKVAHALVACCDDFATTIDRRWDRLWAARGEDPLTTAETLRIDDGGRIRELGRRPNALNEIEGQYMGLTRFSAPFAARLPEIFGDLDPAGTYDGRSRDDMYMTSFLQLLIDRGNACTPIWVDGGWLELDTMRDLEIYERLHAEGRLAAICDLDAR